MTPRPPAPPVQLMRTRSTNLRSPAGRDLRATAQAPHRARPVPYAAHARATHAAVEDEEHRAPRTSATAARRQRAAGTAIGAIAGAVT